MASIAVVLLVLRLAHGWVIKQENPGLFQGDILLTPEQQQSFSKGTNAYASVRSNLWPEKTIAYTTDASLAGSPKAMAGIRAAIADYEKYTCLRFVRRTNQKSYMHFYNSGGGCFSGVGFSTSENKVSLSDGCWDKSTVIHEMGHSLGLHHEQARPDRDRYVEIVWSNIPGGQNHNFDMEPASKIDSRGTPYDYRSVMHYDKSAFGNGRVTIRTKDPYYQDLIGNGAGFSSTDVRQLNLMYGCPQTTHTFPPTMTPDCLDGMRVCAENAASGLCNDRSWKDFMHRTCRFSCGLCKGSYTPPPFTQGPTPPEPKTPGPSGKCRDVHTNCQSFISMCRDSGWVDHMKRYCAGTCKYDC